MAHPAPDIAKFNYCRANHYLNCFGEKPGQIVITLKDTGNTASTTHFFALHRYLNERRFSEDDNVMLLCFASGLIIGVVIFKNE